MSGTRREVGEELSFLNEDLVGWRDVLVMCGKDTHPGFDFSWKKSSIPAESIIVLVR